MSRTAAGVACRFRSAAALVFLLSGLGGCGGSQSQTPQVTVSESNYQEPGTTPKPEKQSPHDLAAPPAPSASKWTQEETWWTQQPPCPAGSNLYGGAPPDHQEVGCKTDKGVNQGRYTRFHDNGKKAEEGEYQNHVAVGSWVKWNESGIKVVETQYTRGAQDGVETEWFPDGKLKSQKVYKGGKREGLTTLWDSDGNKRSAIEYKAGEQDGPATYWDETGKVARVEQWKNGQQVK